MAISNGRQLEYREAINEALLQEMEADPSIFIIGEEIAGGAGREHLGIEDAWGGAFRTTRGLIQKFGRKRVLDTPISEAGFIGAAVGAATVGSRPIAELMFSDFFGVAADPILSNAAKMRYMYGSQIKVPITLLTRIGAGTRSAAQHSQSFYSVFSHFPGLKCVLPSDPYTAKGLLLSAIRDDDPVIFCEHKLLYPEKGEVPEESYTLPIGKGRILKEGTDVTIVRMARMTSIAMEAANNLLKSDINAEVIDLLSVSPIDYDLILESVKKTSRLVIVDEDTPRCSVASEIAAVMTEEAFDYLDAPPLRVNAPHTPVPYPQHLESLYIPNAERVEKVVNKLFV